jgi:hypothetical protein
MYRPNTVTVIKSRIRLAGHVARTLEIRNGNKILVEDLMRRATRKIILEWILGKQGGKMWTGCIWLRIGASDWLLWSR